MPFRMFAVFTFVAASALCPILGGAAFVVETTQGSILGRQTGAAVEFYGIPYASPPMHALRFLPPVDNSTAKYDGTLNATSPGHKCPQPGGGAEDCLFLNVHASTSSLKARGETAPVMLFLHGGGLTLGAGADLNGSSIAVGRDVIVVTVNYRLGALGLLALNESSKDRGAGNMAYLDQRSAMRWVRAHIGSFGGDASKVMLFGQSAGASSVCVQLALGSKNLFHAALLESPFLCDSVSDRGRERRKVRTLFEASNDAFSFRQT